MSLIFDEYDFHVYVRSFCCVQQLCWCVSLQWCLIALDITLKYMFTANVGQFLVIIVIRTNFFIPTNCDRECSYQESWIGDSFFHVISTLAIISINSYAGV